MAVRRSSPATDALGGAPDRDLLGQLASFKLAALETELIKSLDPPYNVQLVQAERGAWFAAPDFNSAQPAPDQFHSLGPLPSRYSLRGLGAVLELIAGETPNLPRRAAAIRAALPWAPDEASFASGWSLFLARHASSLTGVSLSARRRTLRLARALLLSMAESKLAEAITDADTEGAEPEASIWDPERVCRHIEQSLAGAYQSLRRAGWLCLLADSAVYFREPRADKGRLLLVERARVVSARDMEAGGLPIPAPRPPHHSRLLAFDTARYDELRILTTELKRIQRDGGEVQVRLSGTRLLGGARLRNILRVV